MTDSEADGSLTTTDQCEGQIVELDHFGLGGNFCGVDNGGVNDLSSLLMMISE